MGKLGGFPHYATNTPGAAPTGYGAADCRIRPLHLTGLPHLASTAGGTCWLVATSVLACTLPRLLKLFRTWWHVRAGVAPGLLLAPRRGIELSLGLFIGLLFISTPLTSIIVSRITSLHGTSTHHPAHPATARGASGTCCPVVGLCILPTTVLGQGIHPPTALAVIASLVALIGLVVCSSLVVAIVWHVVSTRWLIRILSLGGAQCRSSDVVYGRGIAIVLAAPASLRAVVGVCLAVFITTVSQHLVSGLVFRLMARFADTAHHPPAAHPAGRRGLCVLWRILTM